jgi:hypothetical protein
MTAAGLEMTASEVLRVRIHQHLRQYPGLTAYEIGRMEADGEVTRSSHPRAADDRRPVIRWRAS